MAAATAVFVATAPSSFALERSSFCGSAVESKAVVGLPSLRRPLKIEASKAKKISVKEPLGPSGDTKYRGGVDASGSPAKGKGVYQYAKKYGANVDGYSPIYAPDEWSANGDTYAGGTTGLALWALTLGGVLLVGVLLVINTSAIGQ